MPLGAISIGIPIPKPMGDRGRGRDAVDALGPGLRLPITVPLKFCGMSGGS